MQQSDFKLAFARNAGNEIICLGNPRLFNDQLNEYNRGARCFSVKTPIDLAPVIKLTKRKSFLARLRG